jgi:hypothetical protein
VTSSFLAALIRLMGLYFLNPLANHSTYLGAGISYGIAGMRNSGGSYDGNGLQGELSVGYELLRASTIRVFAQLEGTLPFYKMRNDDSTGAPDDSKYSPTVVFSLGVGWGRGRSIVVRQL